ncbi:hypothetical protein ACG5V6_14700 [Streptomyces chitinivorans]|uniref:Uncharacterized protein n=1 Tax=Streptomyces chitinivorans TaxID=1257027 RepID=A0ABW7HU80_9ACTN|nr:hypothetical protein [Streptomyces chitinivorans]MDH2408273.1 hypothetical protein [Streptomyces chitinivorans]
MSGTQEEINKLRLQKLKLLDDHYKEVALLRVRLDEQIRQLNRKIAKAGDNDVNLPCLVRKTPGPELTVYHSADRPCGRVRDRRNFRLMPEPKAKDASPYVWLERCSACDWRDAADVHGNRLLGS